jgi:hypothetical protein
VRQVIVTTSLETHRAIEIPQDLRTAIVLREIFGPPRSLQSFDLNSVG